MLIVFLLGVWACVKAQISFTCNGRPPGYYADLETGCKTYHVCDGNSHFTYVCPKRTLFRQNMRICDHSYLVQCQDSFIDFFEDVHPENIENKEKDEETFEAEKKQLEEEYFESIKITTEQATTTEIQTKEQTETTTLSVTTGESTTNETQKKNTTQFPEKKKESDAVTFLKFSLKDLRSLFYIPEMKSNSIATDSVKEFILRVGRDDRLSFKTPREIVGSASGSSATLACPHFCNPKFFHPDSCHPCIMIK